MAIYRGVGGSGESTTNTIVNLVAQYTFDAEAAKIAAQASQTAAEAAKVIAEDASASALADSLIAGTAADEASESAAEAAASAAAAATFDPDNFYTKTASDSLLADKANQSTTYTKTETDSLLDDKADQATTYTKTEVDASLATKQATLVSGTNIKTVNGDSVLGSGDIAITLFPAGTKMMFVQTAAPTGWTKDTTHNDKALRVVSGTASTGGSVAFTTAFASQAVSGTVGSTTLSVAQMPSHGHNTTMNNSYSAVVESDSTFAWARADNGIPAGTTWTTQSTGGGGSHNHSFTGTAINMAVSYVDVIIATKD